MRNRHTTSIVIGVIKKTNNECYQLVKHTWDVDITAKAFLGLFYGMEVTGLVRALIIVCEQ